MYLADYHNHSTVSPDSRTPLTVLCKKAVEAGLHELCVTDHWNLVDQRGQPLQRPFDWSRSLKEWKTCRTRFSGQLELRLGLEVGNGVIDMAATAETLKLPQLDFVIGSLHNAGEKYDLVGTFTAAHAVKSKAEAEAIIDDYVELLGQVAATEDYDVLGHINYLLRYLPPEYHLTLEPWWDQLAEVMKTVISKGKGIEVNTTQGSADPAEWLPYLKLYKDLGGQVLTFGSDSHRPHQVGGLIREAQEVARQAGFKWQTTFKHRTAFFCPL